MKTPDKSSGPRWRVPLLVCLGTALLCTSFGIAAWVMPPLHADEGGTPVPTTPASKATPVEMNGRKTVAMGFVDVPDGVTPIYPLQLGRVAEVIAEENQDLDKGAPLFVMDDRHARFDREKAEAAWKDAEAQLEQAQQLPAQHQAKIAVQEAIIKAKQSKRAAAQADADEAKRLADKKLISDEKAAAAEKLVQAADGEIEAEKKGLEALRLLDAQIGIKRAQLDVLAKKAQLDEAIWAIDECTVKAPYKGKVLRMQVSVGESLGANPRQAAVLFCRTGPRIIRAEIEQEFASKVSLNQPARIKDYATEESGTWTGKVKSISDWYTHRRSMLLEPLQFNDVRTIECIIELDPDQKPLKIGQRMRVTLPTN